MNRPAFLAICLAGLALLGSARGALIDKFAGAAVFSARSEVRTYYAQSKGGSRPLLQIYYFLDDTSHYLIQLRDAGTGSGAIEYQGYVDGRELRGRGTYTISGGVLTVRSGGKFRFLARVQGRRISVWFENSFGSYRAVAPLHRFVPVRKD